MIGRYLTTTAAKVTGGLAAALLAACVILLFWGRAGYASANAWQAKSIAERDNHRATKANFRIAQDAAAAAARAQLLEDERQSAAIAKEIDNAHDEADRWRAAAQRFADAGGMRPESGAGAGSASSAAGAANEADVAKGDDRSGAAAIVWLNRADFETLTTNTDRLLRLHALGQRWIADGFAQPAKED